MTYKTEIVPDNAVIEQFTNGVLLPKLCEIAREVSRRVAIEATVMQGDIEILQLASLSVGSYEDQVLNGKSRLRFREAYGGRILIFCEVLFDKNSSVHNCSGLLLKADWKAGGPMKKTAYAVRYSVWDWTGWW